MAVALVAVGQSPGATNESCVITKPVGLAVGHLMLAQCMYKWTNTIGTISAPAGWTSVRQTDSPYGAFNFSSALFSKIAVQADVDAATFTFTGSQTTEDNRGLITAWSGINTTTPIGASSGQYNAASTTVTAPTITPVANSMILMIATVRDDNTQSGYAIATDNPASWGEAYDLTTKVDNDMAQAMGYATRAQTSATGNGTATTSGSDANIGQLVSISPTAVIDVEISVPVATATGQGEAPTLVRDCLLTIVLAEVQSQAYEPDVIAGTGVIIDIPLTTATGQAYEPAISLGITLEPPAAEVQAAAYEPSLTLDKIMSMPRAEATAQAPAPTLSLGVTLDVPEAVIEALANAPGLVLDRIIDIPLATAIGQAYAPRFTRMRVLVAVRNIAPVRVLPSEREDPPEL